MLHAGYHLLALGLFLPALLWEPQLLAVSLAIALTLLIVVEIIRLGQVPYLGKQAASVLCLTSLFAGSRCIAVLTHKWVAGCLPVVCVKMLVH